VQVLWVEMVEITAEAQVEAALEFFLQKN